MKTFRIFAALFLAHLVLSATAASAASLGGTWAGAGYIHPAAGDRQRVRCVVRYDRESTKVYGVRATCASSAGSIRQTGEVLKIRSNMYVGDFYNQQFDIRGRVRVSITGGRQTVTFSSSDGSGRLTLSKR